MRKQTLFGLIAVLLSIIFVYIFFFYYGKGRDILVLLKKGKESKIEIDENKKEDRVKDKQYIIHNTSGDQLQEENGLINEKINSISSGNKRDIELSGKIEKKELTSGEKYIWIYPFGSGKKIILSGDNFNLFPPFLFLKVNDFHFTGSISVSSGNLVMFWSTGFSCSFVMEHLNDYINVNYLVDKTILEKNKLPGKEVCFINFDDNTLSGFVFWGIDRNGKWLWFKIKKKDYYKLKLKLYKKWKETFRR